MTFSFFLSRPSLPDGPTRFSIELKSDESLISGGSVLAVSPDGFQVVYTGLQRAYLRPRSEFDMEVIPGSEGQGLRNPFFRRMKNRSRSSLTSTVRSREFTCRRITDPHRTHSRSVGHLLV